MRGRAKEQAELESGRGGLEVGGGFELLRHRLSERTTEGGTVDWQIDYCRQDQLAHFAPSSSLLPQNGLATFRIMYTHSLTGKGPLQADPRTAAILQ